MTAQQSVIKIICTQSSSPKSLENVEIFLCHGLGRRGPLLPICIQSIRHQSQYSKNLERRLCSSANSVSSIRRLQQYSLQPRPSNIRPHSPRSIWRPVCAVYSSSKRIVYRRLCYQVRHLISAVVHDLFYRAYCVSVRQIKLTYVGFRAHVRTASRIVSYKIVSSLVKDPDYKTKTCSFIQPMRSPQDSELRASPFFSIRSLDAQEKRKSSSYIVACSVYRPTQSFKSSKLSTHSSEFGFPKFPSFPNTPHFIVQPALPRIVYALLP